jgi:hypothetical protein
VLMLRTVMSAVNVDAARIGRRFSRLSLLGWSLVTQAQNSRRPTINIRVIPVGMKAGHEETRYVCRNRDVVDSSRRDGRESCAGSISSKYGLLCETMDMQSQGND